MYHSGFQCYNTVWGGFMLCEPATYLTWRTFALHKASIAATLWEVRFVQIINIPLLILNSDFCLWCYRADPALWGLNLLQVIQPCKADCASHHWPGCCWLLGLQRWRSVLLILKNQYAVNIINTNTGHDTAWQLLIGVRMTGTEGGVDVLVLMSSSSSVTLLSMKSTCSAFPFTVKSTMVFNTSHSTNNDLWPVPLSSPLLDSSSSSARLLWSLLTSAMRRERSEKSSADWTHSTCQWNTDLFI